MRAPNGQEKDVPADQVDAMIANRQPVRTYNPEVAPVLKLLKELKQRPAVSHFIVDKPDFRLELKSNGTVITK